MIPTDLSEWLTDKLMSDLLDFGSVEAARAFLVDALTPLIQRLHEERRDTQALNDVRAERHRQDAKWGEQNHDPFTYLTVLMEEVGELSQAALHARFGGHAADDLRKEAVQTAAVALAIVECIDRNKWTWREDIDNCGNPLAPASIPAREAGEK